MKLRGLLGIFLAVVLAGGIWALMQARNRPPEVLFVKAKREFIANSVPTNGRVEPIEWAEARADRAGAVQKILVQRGQTVAQGAPLIEFDATEAKGELTAAQARVTQAKADLDVIARGGRSSDLSSIAAETDRARLDLATAQKDYDVLSRLQSKQAATPFEVAQAKERVDQAQLQIRSLEQKRAALTSPPDKTTAEARLLDAESAVTLAEDRIRKSVLKAPIAGTIYQFDLRPGAYLNAGDLVASIGQLDRVRVKVFVDEPDLGRVAKGMPVVITWDAKPGRKWNGAVDRTPTQIVALGSRQVGEVLCVIENPGHELLPGTNVNADILAQTVENALTIPKEAVRHEADRTGVFTLQGDTLEWKNLELGISNTTHVQVKGLNEGDPVALPNEKPLKAGMMVVPVFP